MSFELDLTALTAKAGANLERTVRGVVLALGERIVERSPVGDPTLWKRPPPPGYVGGRFRANWQYGYGNYPRNDLPTIDASGAASVARITTGVSESPAAGVHYLVNNLPYAQELENGHSTQAPAGMVGLAVVEFQSIVDAEARKL